MNTESADSHHLKEIHWTLVAQLKTLNDILRVVNEIKNNHEVK